MQELCRNCFMPIESGSQYCYCCGYNFTTEKKYEGSLPPFTELNNGRYILGRVLGKGGFGITYVAKDIQYNCVRAIKEYMPSEYSSRAEGTMNIVPHSDRKSKYVFEHGREKFRAEAETLATLRGDPIIVDIINFFYQNNTAYLVMEFIDGKDLRRMTAENGGRLDPALAKAVFVTIASTLMEVHKKGILHRDISPENIMISNDGAIKLFDFGAARSYVSDQNKGMSILLKKGFAPPEQYETHGNQGPWTDVYALCATFYNIVSGVPLVDALFRYRGQKQPTLYELGCEVSKQTSNVIEKGMELDTAKRYKNFKELLDDLDIDIQPEKDSQKSAENIVSDVSESSAPENNIPSDKLRVPSKGRSRTRVIIRRGKNNTAGHSSQNENGTGIIEASVSKSDDRPFVAFVNSGEAKGKIYLRLGEKLAVGRSRQTCKFVVGGDNNISRNHCDIKYDKNKKVFLITDISSNGTYFENGDRFVPHKEETIYPGTKFYLATSNHMLIVDIE